MRWYVARTKPHAELDAAAELNQLARVGTFIPVRQKLVRHHTSKRGWSVQNQVRFVGYLLVEFDIGDDEAWNAVVNARGVRRLLGAERPVPVPQTIMERLFRKDMARCRRTVDDLLGQQRRDRQRKPFDKGVSVNLRADTFSGLPAVVDEDDGADDLWLFIAGKFRVKVPANQVEAA